MKWLGYLALSVVAVLLWQYLMPFLGLLILIFGAFSMAIPQRFRGPKLGAGVVAAVPLGLVVMLVWFGAYVRPWTLLGDLRPGAGGFVLVVLPLCIGAAFVVAAYAFRRARTWASWSVWPRFQARGRGNRDYQAAANNAYDDLMDHGEECETCSEAAQRARAVPPQERARAIFEGLCPEGYERAGAWATASRAAYGGLLAPPREGPGSAPGPRAGHHKSICRLCGGRTRHGKELCYSCWRRSTARRSR